MHDCCMLIGQVLNYHNSSQEWYQQFARVYDAGTLVTEECGMVEMDVQCSYRSVCISKNSELNHRSLMINWQQKVK